MARRTQVFSQIPWTGGINTTVDAGVIPSNDVVKADDVVFTTSGARIKREGYDYFDAASAVPTVLSVSSIGTTRTMTFDQSLRSGDNERLVIGEKITVASTGGWAAFVGDFTVASIGTKTILNDTITYTASTPLTQGLTGTTAITVTRNHSYIGLKDFWYLDTGDIDKTQLLIAVSDMGKIFRYDTTGKRFELDLALGSTALSSPTQVSFAASNNKLIMGFDKTANVPKKYDPVASFNEFSDLGGSPPNFTAVQEHLGRLFTNDKARPDRLHYSSPGNPEEWGGVGDSGARDIFPGDGDPEGIITIMPPFKGSLFISKRNRVIEITGQTPELFLPAPVSNGIGALSNNAVAAVDLDDLVFMSSRGFHTLLATASHGDYESNFLSTKIQRSFNDDFDKDALKLTQATYIPTLNSVAFSIKQDGATTRDQIWLYNFEFNEWYRWPDVSAEALSSRLHLGRETRLIYGTDDARVVQAQNDRFIDFETTGPNYVVESGAIYPDGNPQTLKNFKKFSLFFKPKGDLSFTAKIKVDNQAEQTLTFSQGTEFDLLGSTFILGTSILGNAGVLAPFTGPIDGIGRGLTIKIESSSTNLPVEIYGYSIEFEPADINQEVL